MDKVDCCYDLKFLSISLQYPLTLQGYLWNGLLVFLESNIEVLLRTQPVCLSFGVLLKDSKFVIVHQSPFL